MNDLPTSAKHPTEPPSIPYDQLIDELRETWGIEASWDGLRKFWYIGWTDEHVEDIGRLHDELRDAIVELLGNRCDWVQSGVTAAHDVLDRASMMGRGTCEMTFGGTDGMFACSECLENIPPLANFCPNCGARVIGGES